MRNMVRRNTLAFLLMKANRGKLTSGRIARAAKEEGVLKIELVKLLLREAERSEASVIAINRLREIEKTMTGGRPKLSRPESAATKKIYESPVERKERISMKSSIERVIPSKETQEARLMHAQKILEKIKKKKEEKQNTIDFLIKKAEQKELTFERVQIVAKEEGIKTDELLNLLKREAKLREDQSALEGLKKVRLPRQDYIILKDVQKHGYDSLAGIHRRTGIGERSIAAVLTRLRKLGFPVGRKYEKAHWVQAPPGTTATTVHGRIKLQPHLYRVLRGIQEHGYSKKRIAEKLNLDEHTVEQRISTLRKLGFKIEKLSRGGPSKEWINKYRTVLEEEPLVQEAVERLGMKRGKGYNAPKTVEKRLVNRYKIPMADAHIIVLTAQKIVEHKKKGRM